MVGNWFMGKLQSHAFSMHVTGSASIGPDNNFTRVSDGAFEKIKVGDQKEIVFKDNEVHRADSGALKFNEGRVRFGGSMFTGLGCPCEGGAINGATEARDHHVQRLLGDNPSGNEETFGASFNSLYASYIPRRVGEERSYSNWVTQSYTNFQ